MSNNEDEFADVFAFTQGRVLANQFILFEVARTLARQSEQPRRFVDGLYDRVCSRSDQLLVPGEKAASASTREAIDIFFSTLSRNL